jgi:hypothetical protein
MKRIIAALCAATVATVSSGCATEGAMALSPSTTPQYDRSFGESVRQARALQTLNPEAGRNDDPVRGIDGQAGAAAIDRYHESFRTPARSFDVMNIGGSLGGGSQ